MTILSDCSLIATVIFLRASARSITCDLLKMYFLGYILFLITCEILGKEMADDEDTDEEMSDGQKPLKATQQEKLWQTRAYDYNQRFCGHCNTTTDIKEANFIGE